VNRGEEADARAAYETWQAVRRPDGPVIPWNHLALGASRPAWRAVARAGNARTAEAVAAGLAHGHDLLDWALRIAAHEAAFETGADADVIREEWLAEARRQAGTIAAGAPDV
jgi:hypothetical protein